MLKHGLGELVSEGLLGSLLPYLASAHAQQQQASPGSSNSPCGRRRDADSEGQGSGAMRRRGHMKRYGSGGSVTGSGATSGAAASPSTLKSVDSDYGDASRLGTLEVLPPNVALKLYLL